jgi:basic membrane protein A
MDAKNGTFKAGQVVLGLKEQGVGWADDEHNKALITADMRKAVDAAAADIAAGKTAVHDFMSDAKCPAL